ncbi:DUF2254 family protein [Ilumatobacter sp.]|uniref:DUF2254 family protein n=1 Tax=Ilumatobacter sp. TaxID=1967498 RepID=UPI003AF61FB3
MPSIRGILDDVETALEEDQALVAVIGALGGAVGAFVVERFGPEPDPEVFAITVDQARASLLSALALVFTGLSIVLALTALATGNMASKFSPRLLRMKLRTSGNKWVLTVFAATAAFIITSQVLLRTSSGEELAPPLMLSISVVLLVVTGVMIVWYIDGTLQSMRVDRAIRWVGRRIERTAKRHEHTARHDVVVDTIELQRPPGAIDLLASDDGYVVSIDTGRLARLAGDDGCIVVEAGTGQAVVRGECIGWVSTPTRLGGHDLAEVLDCLTIANVRDPERDIGYTIDVLVDIGLMALSPAVNDPRTGLECTEMLTAVCVGLARRDVGIRTRTREDGSPSVVVIESTMGDYLDAAGRQILLYGADDRTVTAALLRLGRQGERAARSQRDRGLAKAFADDVEALRSQAPVTAGRSW